MIDYRQNREEAWAEMAEKVRNLPKGAAIANLVQPLVEEPLDRIIVECVGAKTYIRVNISDDKSVSFCKLIAEAINKEAGGVKGLQNAIIELAVQNQCKYKCLVTTNGNEPIVVEKFVDWGEEEVPPSEEIKNEQGTESGSSEGGN